MTKKRNHLTGWKVHWKALQREASRIVGRQSRRETTGRPFTICPRDLVRLAPHVRPLVVSLGVSAADADDVTQEVIVAAWRSLSARRFIPSGGRPVGVSLANWLTGILWNLVLHHRRSPRLRLEDLAADPAALSPVPLVVLPRWEAVHALCLVSEPLRKRLMQFHSVGPERMAAVAGVRVRAIHLRVDRARLALLVILGSDWD